MSGQASERDVLHPIWMQSYKRIILDGSYIYMAQAMLDDIAKVVGVPEGTQALEVNIKIRVDNQEVPGFNKQVQLSLVPKSHRHNYKVPGMAQAKDIWLGKLLHCWILTHTPKIPGQAVAAAAAALPTLTLVLYTPEKAEECYNTEPLLTSLEVPDAAIITQQNGLKLPASVYYLLFNPTGRRPLNEKGTFEPMQLRVVLTGDVPGGRLVFPNAKWNFAIKRKEGSMAITKLTVGGVESNRLGGKRVVKCTRLEDGGMEVEIRS